MVSLKDMWTYHVVPDEISEVSEFSLFRSCTMLKSANFEKSVFPCPISLADFRDSISLTSSNFFLTSSPPFYKRRSNVSLEDMVLYRHTRTLEFFWILSKNIAVPKLSKEKYLEEQYKKHFSCAPMILSVKVLIRKKYFPSGKCILHT